MTRTLSLGNKTIRPHGTQIGMHVKTRLERVMANPQIYDIEPSGSCAIITNGDRVSLDDIEIRRIRESVDLDIFYIRDDGIRVRWRALL